MGKIALLFPGQGAQYVGMGKDFYENIEVSKQIFIKANQSLGYDITKVCFEGPEEELRKTEVTQPAILTVGVAIWEALKSQGIKVDATAGLSLGEYSALVAANVLSFEEAVVLVKKRGAYMQEAVPQGVGTMAAIIGLDDNQVKQVCQQASAQGIVEPANFNCPGQIVIGGEVKAVEEACRLATEMGARKAVTLAVSAPFHTSMLQPAAENLAKELKATSINDAVFPVVSSVTADYLIDQSTIKTILADQVCSPVLWEATMNRLLSDGFDTFIEIGPGKTLKGFMRRIDKSATVLTINDYDSLQEAIQKLEE